jgi:hypothetical protein
MCVVWSLYASLFPTFSQFPYRLIHQLSVNFSTFLLFWLVDHCLFAVCFCCRWMLEYPWPQQLKLEVKATLRVMRTGQRGQGFVVKQTATFPTQFIALKLSAVLNCTFRLEIHEYILFFCASLFFVFCSSILSLVLTCRMYFRLCQSRINGQTSQASIAVPATVLHVRCSRFRIYPV